MSLGFIAFIMVSLVALVTLKMYQSQPVDPEVNIAQSDK